MQGSFPHVEADDYSERAAPPTTTSSAALRGGGGAARARVGEAVQHGLGERLRGR